MKKALVSKWYVLFLLFIVMAANAYPKNSDIAIKHAEIDSLLKILPNSPPSEKVDILLHLSRIYLSFSLDSSREYALIALNNAKEINDPVKIAEAYKFLGNISMYKGDYNNVINFYDSSIIQYKIASDSMGQAKVWNNLGIIYHNLGDYQKSIDYHLKSLDLKTKMNDSAGIANSYNNIGSIYLDLNDYSKSYNYFQNALEISRKLNQRSNVAGILNNLGMISQEAGDQEKAISYFNESLDVGANAGNQRGMADSYHNLGKSNFLLGNYSEALDYYKKALDTYEVVGIKNGNTYNNIAQVYIELAGMLCFCARSCSVTHRRLHGAMRLQVDLEILLHSRDQRFDNGVDGRVFSRRQPLAEIAPDLFRQHGQGD